MDLIGQALAGRYLHSRGFVAAFDVPFTRSEEPDGPIVTMDVAAFRFENREVRQLILGAVRGWWSPSTYLTPSLIRLHLLPSLLETLSNDAVSAFTGAYGLTGVPVERLFFFSQASPEKAEEAEEILTRLGIGTVYLERLASELAREPVSRDWTSDPLLAQVRGLIRGAWKDGRIPPPADSAVAPDSAAATDSVPDPQMAFDLFSKAPRLNGNDMESH